jgi:hypothetical protein
LTFVLISMLAVHRAGAAVSQDNVTGLRFDPSRAAVYICGNTTGSLGPESQGATDAWIAKLDPLGRIEWIRTYGTSGEDTAQGIAFDGAGNIYVTGNTVGTPELGGTNDYVVNAWLNKYDNAGNLVYSRSVKTKGTTEGTGVYADRAGNVFLCGFTASSLTNFGSSTPNQGELDAWFGKLDTNGFRAWLDQVGTPGNDAATAVAAGPRGTMFVTGFTDGDLGGPAEGARDYWIAQYDANGNQLWIRQDGTPKEDVSTKLDTDASGNPVIGGFTLGPLASRKDGSDLDVWAARYRWNGRRQWARQLDSGAEDSISGIAANRQFVDVSGASVLADGPQTPWLTRFSLSGKPLDAGFFDNSKLQEIQAIDNDPNGNKYLAINVNSLARTGGNDHDVTITKLDPDNNLVWSRRIYGAGIETTGVVANLEPDVTYVIHPPDTDPQINTWIDDHLVFHNNGPSRNGQLVVFFPGSYAFPRSYIRMLKAFASAGFYVVGLTYPNSFDVLGLCDENSLVNPLCQDQVRLEILTGANDSPFVNVSANNSIENRLGRLLAFLEQQHPDEDWDQWFDPATLKPVWSKLILSGHSQGSGHAAFISKRFEVARVVMLAGPEDQDAQGNPSPWILSSGATPIDRYYGFGHVNDTFYSRFTEAWAALGLDALGAPVNVDNSSAPFENSHQLLTAAPPSDGSVTGLKAHNSPAADLSTPILPDTTPIYRANEVWQYLVGGL